MADSQKKRKSPTPRALQPRARKPASTAQRVGDLAWAGQHAQAIELATAALAATGLSVGSRLDLRSALSTRITVELLGPVPFKGKATAVDVFSVDLGQKL